MDANRSHTSPKIDQEKKKQNNVSFNSVFHKCPFNSQEAKRNSPEKARRTKQRPSVLICVGYLSDAFWSVVQNSMTLLPPVALKAREASEHLASLD